MTKSTNAIILFSDDFRIKDNPALVSACKEHENIIPLFIFNENYQGRKIGAAAKVFLHHTLKSFDNLLKTNYSCNLILKKGDEISCLKEIISENKIDAIYFNRSHSKKQIEFEEKIAEKFSDLEVKSFKAKTLFEPNEIKNGKGEYFKVFTPFFKECLKNQDLVGSYLKAPQQLNSKHKIKSLKLEELNLLPKNEGNWHEKLIENWQFDYDKLDQNISNFLSKKLDSYQEERNRCDINATSCLSPYFRFGIISPRIVFNAAQNHENHKHFISEICWREFAYHVYHFNQEIATKEIRQEYSTFAWQNDAKNLKKWQKGETGFDIVDAGMKEIYATGIMHNRVRMIAASFLIKDLLIDWRKGEEYFWDCLIDADFAVNPFSWQWVFGSGFDAAPYFRVFNPELQQKKFDPNSKYCQKWLNNRIMTPKIVEHDEARKIVLQEYKKVKS